MPRIRDFFRDRKPSSGSDSSIVSSKPSSEETSILVGLPAVVGIVPWIPPSAFFKLSEIVQQQIERLETTRHNREYVVRNDV